MGILSIEYICFICKDVCVWIMKEHLVEGVYVYIYIKKDKI